MTSKNEKAWRQLFGKYNILKTVNQDGYFEISANQIKEYREPRLMTKFDQRSNLPDIFLSNNLSILPITRGSYIIAKFNAYEDVNYVYAESIKHSRIKELINQIERLKHKKEVWHKEVKMEKDWAVLDIWNEYERR